MKEKLIKNTIYYISIPVLRNVISFLTLPIMTHYLTPSDYGKIALILMVTSSFGSFLLFDIGSASVRFFFKYEKNIKYLGEMFSSYTIYSVLISCFGLFTLALGFPLLNQYVFKQDIALVWIIIFFLQFMLSSFNVMNQYVLQNRHEGGRWAINEGIAFVVQTATTLLLVVGKIFTFEAIIIGSFVAEVVKAFVVFYSSRIPYVLKFRGSYLKEAFKYSWPMVPVLALDIIYRTVDKTMLSIQKGISQVGILDMSNKFSGVQKMTMDAVGGTLSPVTMNLLTQNSEESKMLLAKIFMKVVALLLFISLMIILFTQEIVYALTTKEFYFVIYVLPIYIYYNVFSILGMIAYWLIRFPGKTYYSIHIQIVFIICNVVLNVLLIPRYGVIGAAIAAAVAGCISQVLQLIIGLRLLPLPLDLPRLSALFGMLIFETILLYGLYALHLNLFLNIGLKLMFLVGFVGFVMILKVISVNEILTYGKAGIAKIKHIKTSLYGQFND